MKKLFFSSLMLASSFVFAENLPANDLNKSDGGNGNDYDISLIIYKQNKFLFINTKRDLIKKIKLSCAYHSLCYEYDFYKDSYIFQDKKLPIPAADYFNNLRTGFSFSSYCNDDKFNLTVINTDFSIKTFNFDGGSIKLPEFRKSFKDVVVKKEALINNSSYVYQDEDNDYVYQFDFNFKK